MTDTGDAMDAGDAPADPAAPAPSGPGQLVFQPGRGTFPGIPGRTLTADEIAVYVGDSATLDALLASGVYHLEGRRPRLPAAPAPRQG